ncbi:uncharacterized protein LOC103998466 [Musa acuminata AAA Group]|uniref:uncharacterized protein LOC103998466 n=1 Tax=Musa acuminata AAA Group TaxID=214697 RepID=UPI0031DCA43E
MCSSNIKSDHAAVAEIDGRPVLQPASNRVTLSEAGWPLKKPLQKSASLPTWFTKTAACFDVDSGDSNLSALPKLSPPPSPTSKPARIVPKRGNEPNGLCSITEKPVVPKVPVKSAAMVRKNPKKSAGGSQVAVSIDFSSAFEFDRVPGSIAAAQREHAALVQAQRKLRVAHYGRTAAKLEEMVVSVDHPGNGTSGHEEKKCCFITRNSDHVYVAYHDEEWGVPVHDDRMLFELLVLTGAQAGMDWTAILKKRNGFRAAFAEFDAWTVSKFTERQMASISVEHGLDLGRVRGVVANANRILEVRREFESLDKYLWGFVNHKPISTSYRSCRKIPAKTSKSESISKDMVRRGFRFVGPTVVHSFMQAAGLTNGHIVSCPRHRHCSTPSAIN